MKNSLKKLGILTIVLMFLATSITIASAKNERTVVSKAGGNEVTEYFNLCSINYKDDGHSIGMFLWISKHCSLWGWINCENGTVTINTSKETLNINGYFDLTIMTKDHPIMKSLFNVSIPFIGFVGKGNLPVYFLYYMYIKSYWLKGIARGVEITYYQYPPTT